MSITPVNGAVLHNVTVHTPGRKFVQKPIVIKDLDLGKVKYAPSGAPAPTPKPKKTGIIAAIGGKLKKGAAKVGNGLKSAGTKLTKTKGGKAALIGTAIGALLIGAGLLIKKLTDDDKAEKPTEPTTPNATEPTTPGATEPTTPGATEPTTPGATEPTTPGATEPTAPSTPNPSNQENPGAADPTTPAVIPALPGEAKEGSWAVAEDKDFEMVCHDASGRTRDIKGKLKIQGEYEKNPDELTITDNSSGNDHVYKYKKIGVDDNGRPIYKCVSMNDRKVITENQYVLEWDKDFKVPSLIQNKNHDNYGTGLRFKA